MICIKIIYGYNKDLILQSFIINRMVLEYMVIKIIKYWECPTVDRIMIESKRQSCTRNMQQNVQSEK